MSVVFHGQKTSAMDHGLSKALMDFYQVKDLEEVFLCPVFIDSRE